MFLLDHNKEKKELHMTLKNNICAFNVVFISKIEFIQCGIEDFFFIFFFVLFYESLTLTGSFEMCIVLSFQSLETICKGLFVV